MSRQPLIGITACSKQIGLYACHVAGDKHVRVHARAAEDMSLIQPSLGPLSDFAETLRSPDGQLLTRSLSSAKPLHDRSPTFALGVQMHAQWQAITNPDYLITFQAFGDACRKQALQRGAVASNNA